MTQILTKRWPRPYWLLLISTPAVAWDAHQKIMSLLIESPAAAARGYLNQEIKIPCTADEKKTIHDLSAELQINEEKVPSFSSIAHSEDCSKTVKFKVRDLFQSQFIDEPDMGMDQDLPDSADPKGDRQWMGGKTGPTSQGFRHMYFPGMKWSAPFRTFQYPTHAVGQAPERFNKLHAISEKFFKEGDVFWGIRTLVWSLHFVQDLLQPFHATQILSLKFVPFKTIFSGFVARTTQSVANYHYAYEGLTLEYLKEGEPAEMVQCLNLSTPSAPVGEIMQVIQYSNQKGENLGADLYKLFPKVLKSKEFDLTRREDPDSLDYYAMIHSVEELPGLKSTFDLTCELMQTVAKHTWGELDRALKH